ncbi:four helix bundle protein [Neorhizobium petrolearium]|uniref:four helix bundle protein n=1 Tax=Neorhizobium petrolearium TaxID=515361 RepID=UPI00398AB9F2
MRRSAASVAASIAESRRRENTSNFIQFLGIAQGSLKELGRIWSSPGSEEPSGTAVSEPDGAAR